MKYSIVVPIYNDAYLATEFVSEFQSVFQLFLQKDEIKEDVELIFVNDGSSNNSIETLISLSEQFGFIKLIDLSRNFGQHIALTCGYQNASGDFVGMLNVDMQDPPSEIPKLIKYLIDGEYDIVFGLVERRKTSLFNRLTSNVFNSVLYFLTKTKTPLNVATIRIMNRKFLNAYNQLKEKSRYLPGLENWLGFKHGFLPIEHRERRVGKSSYNFRKRMLMAIDSIISFSDYPLRMIIKIGFIIAFLGFLMILALIVSKLYFIDFQRGYISLVSIIVFLGGMQMMVIGFASLYIGRILKETQNRPLYVVNEKYNF